MAFTLKKNENNGNFRGISIENNDILSVTKRFAENNLSDVCLSLADGVTSTHYKWTFEETAYAVVFEVPALFNFKDVDLIVKIISYCPDYFIKMGLNTEDVQKALLQNYNKKLIL